MYFISQLCDLLSCHHLDRDFFVAAWFLSSLWDRIWVITIPYLAFEAWGFLAGFPSHPPPRGRWPFDFGWVSVDRTEEIMPP